MTQKELKEFLDEKTVLYNNLNFIESDPISIPHQFSKKEDIEIAAFLSATIAWGNRKMIIKNANEIMRLMDYSPFSFVSEHSAQDLKIFDHFVHRTFNATDAAYFIKALKNIYTNHGGLEKVFTTGFVKQPDSFQAIEHFREKFLSIPTKKVELRSSKHISSPTKGSSSKRINMFLRWMVRNDKTGVDFGIWKGIKPSQLILPLDVHTGNVGRKLGLLKSNQNNWSSALEITNTLRKFDSKDPVKYDFALFGLGVFEKF